MPATQVNPSQVVGGLLPAGHKLILSPLAPDVAADEEKGVEASAGSRGYVERSKQNEAGDWELVKTSQLVADPAPAYSYGEFATDVQIRIVCEQGGYAFSIGNNTGADADPVVFEVE